MEKSIQDLRRLLLIYDHGHTPQLTDAEKELLLRAHEEDFRNELTSEDFARLAELIRRAELDIPRELQQAEAAQQ